MGRLRFLLVGVLPLAVLLVVLVFALRLRRRWGVPQALLARYPEFGGWPLLLLVFLACWTVLRGAIQVAGGQRWSLAWQALASVAAVALGAGLAWRLVSGPRRPG